MIEVTLETYEMLQAAMAGVMRQVESHKKRRPQNYGANPETNQWQRHIAGALAEAALAKYLDVYWSGKGVLRGLDVGNYDVRSSEEHNRRLILHEADPDDRIFWFVTGNNEVFQIHGWIYGHEGKQPEYWSDPQKTGRPAFFVPREALRNEKPG